MSDPLYDTLLETANRLIGEKGKPAYIIRVTATGPDYDPVLTPQRLAIAFVETGYSFTNRVGTNIENGDVVGLVSMDGEVGVINFDDKFEVDGVELSMVDVMPLNPGGVQLLTEIHARK